MSKPGPDAAPSDRRGDGGRRGDGWSRGSGEGGLRAGVAAGPLPVERGLPMMGYGARTGTALGEHDVLRARALYLESAEGRVLWIECDLCLLAVSQAAEVRGRIAERIGLPPSAILVGCTHTHSGPDSGIAVALAGGEAPTHVSGLLDAAVETGIAAFERAEPARLGCGRTSAAIGRNRRRAGAAIDESVTVVRVDHLDGRPLAVVYVHGCHPTVLGHDNLDYSADWPGEASRRIEERLPGALAIFGPGGHADVDPRTRGLLDLAIPDQSLGEGFEEVHRLGVEVGEAVARCAASIETDAAARVSSRTGSLRIPVHGADGTPEERARRLERRRLAALDAVGLPPDARPRTAQLYALERQVADGRPVEEVRDRLSRLRLYLRDRTAPRIVGSEVAEVEVQVLRLGDLTIAALPIECCADVALDWSQRLAPGSAALLSIANGWLRYLPHERAFEEPGAELGYEVLQSTFVPDASRRLLDLAERLAFELGARTGSRGGVRPPSVEAGARPSAEGAKR